VRDLSGGGTVASQKRTVGEDTKDLKDTRDSSLASWVPLRSFPASLSIMNTVEQHRRASPHVLGFAVITVSDTRTPGDDVSGRTISEMAREAGHRVAETFLVPDEVAAIRGAVEQALTRVGVDVVVLTGGTGFSPRDVTLEAVGPLLQRPVEGFGELFRMLSWQQVGSAAMLSRAAAGLVGSQAVFLLPGSPKAVSLAMEKLILPEVGHLLGQVRKTAETAG
jgi:molybdopterin adenylyltransferase